MVTIVTCPKCHQDMPEHRVSPQGCALCYGPLKAQLDADNLYWEHQQEKGE